MSKGIYARELLKTVFVKFKEIGGSQERKFSETSLVKIARDIDGAGYMSYKKALVIKVDENIWILSMGIASGDYQAGLYDSDIMAVKILPDASVDIATIVERIEKENYFKSSLIIARNTGILYVGKNCFCENVRKALNGVLSEFLIQSPEFDHKHIDLSTLSCPVTEQALYKPEFAEVLSEKLIEILKSS